jgi:ubiquinone/menaquinone biosynthesis C-methylase UbiE
LSGEGVTNVVPVLGTVRDPKLPAASVDTILMVDVYHEFDFPFEMVEAMCRALKPGGRIVFVEYRAEDKKVPIKRVHKMSVAQVKKEMTAHPLRFSEAVEVLPWQHIIIFTRN